VFVTHGAAHGSLPLRTAVQKSCNIYFYHVAETLSRGPDGRIDLSLGASRLRAWAERLGLGRPTGLGFGGEPAGNLAVRDPRNLAVGQGETLVTPLQVAQLYGLVASDGRMPALRLVRELAPEARPPVGLNPRFMALLRDAFAAVVNEQGGTGYSSRLPDVRFAGKTGTAQSGRGEPHAWFAGFAPAEDPRIAFAVIIEHGGHGGQTAGPIARDLVKACLDHGYIDGQQRPAAGSGKTRNGKAAPARPGNGLPPRPQAPPPAKPAPVPVG
jgi:penicillin-binding protein 2